MPTIGNFNQVIPSLQCNIYWKDLDGRYLGCNEAQAGCFELAIEHVLGKTDFDLTPEEIASTIRKNDLRVIKTGKAELIEETVISYGKSVVMLSHKAPLRDENGIITGIVGTSVNMSQQRLLLDKLSSESNRKQIIIEQLVENIPGHIYCKDENGIITFCNNAQAQYFGFESANELIGKTDHDLYETDVANEIYENDLRIMSANKTEIVEEDSIKDNIRKAFISHKAPLKDQTTGKVYGILGVSIDITKQKELEADYEERMRELAVALEVKKDFLNNMRHEIATPLVGFMNMTEELEHSWDKISESERKDCLQHILNGRDRLMSMLSNLLDLSKFQQGKLSFEFNTHDIRYLIIEVAEEFKDLTHPIDMDILGNVDTNVYCDPWRIKQLVRNVLANAIKHGGKDKPIRIILDRHQENDLKYLKISVQDEGIGIPEDQLKAIFEPFTESSRTKRKSGGTGVGLTLCKDIITAHKGRIWAENNASGVGSTFCVIMPYEKQSDKVYTYRLTQRS